MLNGKMRFLTEKFLLFSTICAFILFLYGCSKLDLDFGKELEKSMEMEMERIIEDLSAPEEKIFRIIFSSNENQGSLSWLEEQLKHILLPVQDLHVSFATVYVLFAYPSGSMPKGIDPGMIFSNMQTSNFYFDENNLAKASDSDFAQWFSMGRSEKHSIQELQTHLILIVSFSSPHERDGEEQILKFEEVFEFEEDKWELRTFQKKQF